MIFIFFDRKWNNKVFCTKWQHAIPKSFIILISQNTTVLTKVVHGVPTISTTCFGLYIGHYQVNIQSIKRLYNLYSLFWEGGMKSRFTIVGSMKISTLDRITNIWCQYPDLTCLRQIIVICYVSNSCLVAWG